MTHWYRVILGLIQDFEKGGGNKRWNVHKVCHIICNLAIFNDFHHWVIMMMYYDWGEPERAPLKRYCIKNACLLVCPGGHP